jgi:hypothetical protein
MGMNAKQARARAIACWKKSAFQTRSKVDAYP